MEGHIVHANPRNYKEISLFFVRNPDDYGENALTWARSGVRVVETRPMGDVGLDRRGSGNGA